MRRAIQVTEMKRAVDVAPPLPPADWIVRGPGGGRYLAIGERTRFVTDSHSDLFIRNLVAVVDKSTGVQYIRPGSRLERDLASRGAFGPVAVPVAVVNRPVTVADLDRAIAEAKHGRQIHVQWRDMRIGGSTEHEAAGDQAFHEEQIAVYDERIRIFRAFRRLLKAHV